MSRAAGILISVPLFFFVPGWVVARSRLFSSAKSYWVERLLLVLCLSTCITSLIALGLAEIGYLRLWLLDLALAVASLLAWVFLRGTAGAPVSPGPRPGEIAAAALVVAVALVSFMHPAEYISGDADPGYYYNNGYQIADTGSVMIYDESVPEMSDGELNTFYTGGIVQFMPFHLRDRATGRIQPLLFHMLPVWIALFILLFGAAGGLYVVPVFAVFSMLVIFALTLRFSRSLAGAAAAAVLAALFFPQSWFSRFPSSEVFCQFFILSGVLFFVLLLERRDRACALASALAITVAATIRPEAVLVFAPVLLLMFVQALRGEYGQCERYFTNASLAGLAYIWLYIRFAEYFYFHTNARKVLGLLQSRKAMDALMMVFAGAILACFLVFNLPRARRLIGKAGARVGDRLARSGMKPGRYVSASLALLTAATYAYFYFYAPWTAAKATSPPNFFFRTAMFFGGASVFIMVAGLCYLLWRQDARVSFLVASVVIVLTVAFTESRVTSGYLPWLTRRFLPVVVPFFFVGLGFLLARMWSARLTVWRAAGALVAAGFLAFFCVAALPTLGTADYRGIGAQLDALAEKVEGDLVIFSDSFLGEVIGIPLRYQYGVDARIAHWLGDAQAFADVVKKYTDEGRSVLFEGSSARVPVVNVRIFDLLSFKKAFEKEISFPRLSKTFTSWPRSVGVEELELKFFYVEPREHGG